MKTDLNIALLGKDFLWGGGVDFLRNLANALLARTHERNIKVFLLLPVKNKIASLADFRMVVRQVFETVIREKTISIPSRELLYETSLPDYFSNIDGRIESVEYNVDTGLLDTLIKIRADVVLPVGNSLGKSFPVPWIGYIYDFQHKYFPELFSGEECFNRDIVFAKTLRDAKVVIVNAKSVKEDIERFFPYPKSEISPLPFSAAPVLKWLEDPDPERLGEYSLPSRYLLISNQFWCHKSHVTAFQALDILVNKFGRTDIEIVCTGKMEDYRFPGYFNSLKKDIAKLGISDRVHFLGHVPKSDQIAIMKNALAVLQPTKFEGGPGGGAVFDAISLGVPAIMSDIPVNREISSEQGVYYFAVGSSTALAETLVHFLDEAGPRPKRDELLSLGELRKRKLANCLLNAIDHVITEATLSSNATS